VRARASHRAAIAAAVKFDRVEFAAACVTLACVLAAVAVLVLILNGCAVAIGPGANARADVLVPLDVDITRKPPAVRE